MHDVFISYGRSTARHATQIADALRTLGYGVWRDDELPAHRDYSEVIEERLREAKAVVVVWSAEAVKSQWVRAEADLAREAGKLVQLTLDGAPLPMPFNRIQCADLTGWSGDLEAPGWRKVAESVGQLLGEEPVPVIRATAAVAPKLPDKPSIAVLPFTNMSGDPGQDYFTDGMVVEIGTALARFPSLFVTGTTSGLSYRDPTMSRAQIARELGVRYLLEGSVRKAGDRVRVTVRLIEASEAEQLWAERFDGKLDDVFALQDTVANAVASQIEPTIQAAEIRRANARPTEDLTAYDLYLRALPLLQRWGEQSVVEGLDLLEQAVARDPQYALALSTGAGFRAARAALGWSDTPDEDRRIAIDWRARALRIAPDDPDVLSQAATAAIFAGMDKTVAEAAADRGLERNPGSAFAWTAIGLVHAYAGKAKAALVELDTSLRLDPRSSWRFTMLDGIAIALFSLRRFDETVALSRQLCDLVPDFAPLYQPYIAAALAHSGRLAEARAIAKTTSIEALTGWMALMAPADRELIRSGFALAQG